MCVCVCVIFRLEKMARSFFDLSRERVGSDLRCFFERQNAVFSSLVWAFYWSMRVNSMLRSALGGGFFHLRYFLTENVRIMMTV